MEDTQKVKKRRNVLGYIGRPKTYKKLKKGESCLMSTIKWSPMTTVPEKEPGTIVIGTPGNGTVHWPVLNLKELLEEERKKKQ